MQKLIYGAVLAAVVGAVGAPKVAQATLIAYEGFAGETGSLNGQTGTGSGWNGGWVVGDDGSFGAGNQAQDGVIQSGQNLESGDGNAVLLSGITTGGNQYSGAVDFRFIATANVVSATAGNKLFLSFVMEQNGINNRASFLSLYSNSTLPEYSNTPFTGSAGTINTGDVMDVGQEQTGQADWGGVTDTASGVAGAWKNSTVSSGNSNPVLMVVELDYNGGGGSDSAELYINPTSANPASAASEVSLGSNLTLPAINLIRLSALGDSAGGGIAASAYYDEITVGTTFGDVVPEPASVAMLCLPAMALLLSRRRSGRTMAG